MKLSFNFISIIILCMGISLIPGNYNLLSAEESFVQVTLKDKTTVKFEFKSFSLNWTDNVVIDEFSCEPQPFDLKEVEEVYVMALKENPCGNVDKDGRLFDVHVVNNPPLMGFIELSGTSLSGIILGTGEEKSIPYSDVKKIRFIR